MGRIPAFERTRERLKGLMDCLIVGVAEVVLTFEAHNDVVQPLDVLEQRQIGN